ncbi:MAG: SCP2 sterol-binding domain-containing protein [Anaerolineales bacterium]
MPLTIADLISKMPGAFIPEKAQGLNVVIQLNLTGAESGNWNAEIKSGALKVEKGVHPTPNLTVTADSADYIKIFNRELDPMQAFMQGKLKLQGDLSLAMKMSQFFNVS